MERQHQASSLSCPISLPRPHADPSDNRTPKPPTPAATMSAHVGWQQRQRGEGGVVGRMGRPAAGWGLLLSVWAMSQVIRSTHLIHHAPQMNTNKEDAFLPPLPLPHSSSLLPFLRFPLYMWAKGLRRRKRSRVQALPHSWRPWERQEKKPGGVLTHASSLDKNYGQQRGNIWSRET